MGKVIQSELLRDLGYLMATGRPIKESVGLLATLSKRKKHRKRMKALDERLKTSALPDAVREFPDVFDTAALELLAFSDHRKQVDGLRRLASILGAETNIAQRMRTVMTPSIILLIALSSIVLFYGNVVIPVFSEMFKDFGAQLTVPTRFMLDWFPALSWLLIAFIVSMVALNTFVRLADAVASCVPGFRHIQRIKSGIYMARVTALFISLGKPTDEALRLAALSLKSPSVRSKIAGNDATTLKADDLINRIVDTKILPPVYATGLRRGDAAGLNAETLPELADNLETELLDTIHKTMGFTKLFTVTATGGLVLVMVMALFLPIFNLANLVGG